MACHTWGLATVSSGSHFAPNTSPGRFGPTSTHMDGPSCCFGPQRHTIQTPFTSDGIWKIRVYNRMTLGTGGSPGVDMGGVGWWSRSLNLPTWLMLRKKLGVGWGGVMITFLELADMVDSTQEVGGGVGWGDDHVPWTCRHGRCYRRSWGWGGVMITFLELADMVDATQEVRWGLAWCLPHLPQMLSQSLCGGSGSRAPRKRLTVMMLGPQIHCK